MEDKLSVTTASIGLLAVGGKVLDALWELNVVLRNTTPLVNTTLQEAKQCRSSVHVLFKTISLVESACLPLPERAAWIQADDVIVTLADTVLAFSDLQAVCDGMGDDLLSSNNYDAIFQQYEPKLRNLCARIRWHNLSMTMMMTILKCPGLADAQNSRLSLEKRLTRLLSSNADLSARMQSLQDVFLNRGGPSDSLPDYLAAANTPRLLQRTPVLTGNRSRLWSTLSGYSLADIPVLSIIPVPVAIAEVQDGRQFYTFDFARRVSHDLGELMKEDAGQGTSRILGAILGKPMPSGAPTPANFAPARSTTPTTVVLPQARKKKRWR